MLGQNRQQHFQDKGCCLWLWNGSKRLLFMSRWETAISKSQ